MTKKDQKPLGKPADVHKEKYDMWRQSIKSLLRYCLTSCVSSQVANELNSCFVNIKVMLLNTCDRFGVNMEKHRWDIPSLPVWWFSHQIRLQVTNKTSHISKWFYFILFFKIQVSLPMLSFKSFREKWLQNDKGTFKRIKISKILDLMLRSLVMISLMNL